MMDKEHLNWIIPLCLIIGFGLVLLVCDCDCSGIGGFVYQEIEWAEQTYNIVSDCKNLDGMNVPVLYYNDDRKQFYCYEKYDCKEEGCRYKEKYLDPIIQKQRG